MDPERPDSTADTPHTLAADSGPGSSGESPITDAKTVIRGFLMGAADVVPGVSGGTVALILGHYERLVSAIGRIDFTLLAMIRRGRVREVWRYLDLRFLIALAVGCALGIVSLAGAMHFLLDHHRAATMAGFSGLIVASIALVCRRVAVWSPDRWAGVAVGAAVAVAMAVVPVATGSTSPVYLFMAGSLAICAMILPGISGAFLLLLLGVYHPVTGLIKDAARGDLDSAAAVQIVVFAAGCALGLVGFAKLIGRLLRSYHDVTMAVMIGLMAGSLYKLWPLQAATPETAGLELKERVFDYVAAADYDGSVALLAGIAVVSALAVLALDRAANAPGDRSGDAPGNGAS